MTLHGDRLKIDRSFKQTGKEYRITCVLGESAIKSCLALSVLLHFILIGIHDLNSSKAVNIRGNFFSPDGKFSNLTIFLGQTSKTLSAEEVQLLLRSEWSKTLSSTARNGTNGVSQILRMGNLTSLEGQTGKVMQAKNSQLLLRNEWSEILRLKGSMESDQCEQDFGFGLLRRWKAAKSQWCQPSITCYPLMQNGHGGSGDNMCIIQDAQLNLSSFQQSAWIDPAILAYKQSSHEDLPYIHHQTPVISTSCSKVANVWQDSQLPGWNLDWMGPGLSTNANDLESQCSTWSDMPLMIIQRDQFANFYHGSEDFFNVFLALQIADLAPDQVRVLLADLFPWGPYESLWKHLFPHVNTVWEMKNDTISCHRKIIIGIYGPASPLTLINEATPCKRSPLVRAYARWVWSSFNVLSSSGAVAVKEKKKLLWMSRKSSVNWPELAYCDDRYFKCGEWGHLGLRLIERVLLNEDDVLRALRITGLYHVTNADYNRIPFHRQIALDAASDIMVGPHGAGLTHLLYLPDTADVIELFIDGSEQRLHFRNLAAWRGLRYQGVVMANPSPAEAVATAIVSFCTYRNLTQAAPIPLDVNQQHLFQLSDLSLPSMDVRINQQSVPSGISTAGVQVVSIVRDQPSFPKRPVGGWQLYQGSLQPQLATHYAQVVPAFDLASVPSQMSGTGHSLSGTVDGREPGFKVHSYGRVEWESLVDQNEVMADKQCDADFGFGLVRKWKAAAQVWCSPSITCHAIKQTGHGGLGDNLCIVSNAKLDLSAYRDHALVNDIVFHYKQSGHGDVPHIHHRTPVISTSCTKMPNAWQDSQLPGWNLDWMGPGLSTDARNLESQCSTWSDMPLLIIQRDQFANFYHGSEDFFNAFLALQIADLAPDQVRVLLADLFPWGPYESLWKHLFPHVNTVWEMKDNAISCHRKIIVGIYGPASPLTLINQPSWCERSPLVRAYARWVWSRFDVWPYQQKAEMKEKGKLLWVSRKNSVNWPERMYCDDRYFKCSEWTHQGIRLMERILQNEDDVIKALRARDIYDVTAADFKKLPMNSQIAFDAASDIMVGPHGAGLTHLLFLPDTACVVELFIDGSQDQLHFRNLATWRGLRYQGVVMANPSPPEAVVTAIVSFCTYRNLTQAVPMGQDVNQPHLFVLSNLIAAPGIGMGGQQQSMSSDISATNILSVPTVSIIRNEPSIRPYLGEKVRIGIQSKPAMLTSNLVQDPVAHNILPLQRADVGHTVSSAANGGGEGRRQEWESLFGSLEVMSSTQCDDDFGFALVRRWTAAAQVWCSPSVICHPVMQTGHGGFGDNLCIVSNGKLDLSAYHNEALVRNTIDQYKLSSHEDLPYIHHQTPVISTSCQKVEGMWRDMLLPGWNLDWMGPGLSTNANDLESQCSTWSDMPLMIIQRDQFANFYHGSEDFFNAFLALQIADLAPNQVRVLLADLFPWGPYESLWKHLFPHVNTVWEMTQDDSISCHRKIIVGIYGPASPLTLINQPSSCTRSPLVRAYARWVWSSFKIFSSSGAVAVKEKKKLLWMSRKSSVNWPERRYCDDRYFKCQDWSHLGVRQLQRVLTNEDDIVEELQAKDVFDIDHADYNKLSFHEQMLRDASSDVLVGPHGAGLTHLLFLPDDSCMVEIFIDGSEANIHFQNMATWRGIDYHNIISTNPAPVARTVSTILNACLYRNGTFSEVLIDDSPSTPAAADSQASAATLTLHQSPSTKQALILRVRSDVHEPGSDTAAVPSGENAPAPAPMRQYRPGVQTLRHAAAGKALALRRRKFARRGGSADGESTLTAPLAWQGGAGQFSSQQQGAAEGSGSVAALSPSSSSNKNDGYGQNGRPPGAESPPAAAGEHGDDTGLEPAPPAQLPLSLTAAPAAHPREADTPPTPHEGVPQAAAPAVAAGGGGFRGMRSGKGAGSKAGGGQMPGLANSVYARSRKVRKVHFSPAGG